METAHSPSIQTLGVPPPGEGVPLRACQPHPLSELGYLLDRINEDYDPTEWRAITLAVYREMSGSDPQSTVETWSQYLHNLARVKASEKDGYE